MNGLSASLIYRYVYNITYRIKGRQSIYENWRLLSIIILLLDKQIISANTLAKNFWVSKRTYFCDIEHWNMQDFQLSHILGLMGVLDYLILLKYTHLRLMIMKNKNNEHFAKLQEQLLPFQGQHLIFIVIKSNSWYTVKIPNMTVTSATLHGNQL